MGVVISSSIKIITLITEKAVHVEEASCGGMSFLNEVWT